MAAVFLYPELGERFQVQIILDAFNGWHMARSVCLPLSLNRRPIYKIFSCYCQPETERVYDKIHEITIGIKKAILLYRFHKLLLDVFESHKEKQKQKVPIHN